MLKTYIFAPNGITKPEHEDPDMLASLEYIKRNYRRDISVKGMANKCCLSMSAFERRFKKVFQLSPSDYILRFRINCVCDDLIQTNYHISKIAYSNGFSDHSYMSRQFKKVIGISPRQYRNQNSQIQLQSFCMQ